MVCKASLLCRGSWTATAFEGGEAGLSGSSAGLAGLPESLRPLKRLSQALGPVNLSQSSRLSASVHNSIGVHGSKQLCDGVEALGTYCLPEAQLVHSPASHQGLALLQAGPVLLVVRHESFAACQFLSFLLLLLLAVAMRSPA